MDFKDDVFGADFATAALGLDVPSWAMTRSPAPIGKLQITNPDLVSRSSSGASGASSVYHNQHEPTVFRTLSTSRTQAADKSLFAPKTDFILNYKYGKLNAMKREVRMLKVWPAERLTDPLWCELTVTSLIQKCEPFEALSYSWGEAASRQDLYLNGCREQISENVASALRHLRSSDKTISFWVDAICINQSDVDERNHQVWLMQMIYTKANTVRVWLGSESDRSVRAFGIVDSLWDQRSRETVLTSLASDEYASYDQVDFVHTLGSIFEYRWWSRVWILQEALLPRNVWFHCGRWSHHRPAIMQALNDLNNIFDRLGFASGLPSKSPLWSVKKGLQNATTLAIIGAVLDKSRDTRTGLSRSPNNVQDLLVILGEARFSEASDARDRVYGLLGLFDRFLHVLPHYPSRVDDVYRDSAIEMMAQTGTLHLLYHASSCNGSWPTVPTWVPDWRFLSHRTRFFLRRYSSWHAAGDRRLCDFRYLEPDTLKVRVARVDCLQWLGTYSSDIGIYHDAIDTRHNVALFLVEWMRECGLLAEHGERPYVRGGSLRQAFLRTVCMDSADCKTTTSPANLDLWHDEPMVDYLMRWEVPLLQEAGALLQIHRLGYARQGYFGIFPTGAMPGDCIYVIAGLPTPFLLRPSARDLADTYHVVGPCYVYGIMNGESVARGLASPSIDETLDDRFGYVYLM